METIIQLPHAETRTFKAGEELHCKDAPAIRVYSYSPDHVALQIRSYGRLTNHATKNREAYSHTTLDVSAAMELVAALNEWIEKKTART